MAGHITESQFVRLISEAIEGVRKDIKADLQEFVEGAIESHRRRMWVRDEWCCKDMQKFAAGVWLSPNPPRRDETAFGGITLQLRGSTVNYCPFCGVCVGSKSCG